MRVYRIVPASGAAAVFSGDGGLFVDGTWHSRGCRIVNTGMSEAAARLEVLARCASPHLLPPHVRLAADMPDDAAVESVDVASPPGRLAAPAALRRRGAGAR